jgi:exonuclease III
MFNFFFTSPVIPHAGVAIAIKKQLSIRSLSSETIMPGYALGVRMTLSYPEQRTFLLISFYGPHEQNCAVSLVQSVSRYVDDAISGTGSHSMCIIIGGDFNCTLKPGVDRSSGHERNTRYVAALRQMINHHRLIDVWRRKHPNQTGYTHLYHRGEYTASRLDRFYMSDDGVDSVREISTHPSFSDHRAVMIRVMISSKRRRAAYWRYDNQLLSSETYCAHALSFIESVVEACAGKDPCDSWEILKQEIKEHTIIYKRALRINSLGGAEEGVYAREARNLVYRAGWENLVTYDTPATTHLAQWASRTMPKPILKLKIGGKWVDDPEVLAGELHGYLVGIFGASPSSDSVSSRDDSLFSTLDQLSVAESASLDAPLDDSEILAALKSLNKNKAPGFDGLTAEFYLKFWNALKQPFTLMIRESFSRGRLPRSTSTALLNMIPKTSQVESFDNLRPLSITNTDYKIIAKTLSNRLSQVIASVISPEQSYCVPGRTIYDAISTARDLIRKHSQSDMPLAVLSLDQEKAFDKVKHDYLYRVLERIGLGEPFLKRIKTLYCGAVCMAKVVNCISAPFNFCVGIRQGCPLSGQLYSLAFEPLLRKLKAELCPITVGREIQSNITASVYADDINVFIKRDSDFNTVLSAFHVYARISGAKLNLKKSRGLWVGAWRTRPDRPLGIAWSVTGFKCLGIWLDVDPHEEERIVEADILKRFMEAINKWKQRVGPMSLRGRVLVCNQFVAPRIWHILQSYTPKPTTVRKLQSFLVDFVWMNRKHWVKSEILTTPLPEGGLGLVDIFTKIAAFRFLTAQRILFDKTSSPWRNLALECIGTEFLSDDTYNLFLHPENISGGLNQNRYYHSVMDAWKIFNVQPLSPAQDRGSDRPFPTGWPPPNLLLGLQYYSKRTNSCVSLPLHKTKVYKECLYITKGEQWPLAARDADDRISWMAIRQWPTLGLDADVAWRLCHGAWADGVFLQRVGIVDNDDCPWCPGVRATAWHQAFVCIGVSRLWKVVVHCIKLITGHEKILLLHLYAGLPKRSLWCEPQINLANYIVTATKSVIYKEITLFYKNKIDDMHFLSALRNKIRKRLQLEEAYHRANGSLTMYLRFWGQRDFLVNSTSGELNLQCPLFKT